MMRDGHNSHEEQLNRPYIPSAGLMDRLRELNARLRARRPMFYDSKRSLVSVSFDDFPLSAAAYGAQALEQRGWRGTFYTSAGFEGTSNHLGALTTRHTTMSLANSGHEIANHTYHHIDCGRASPRDAALDATRNQAALLKWGLEAPMRSFAFPYGEVRLDVKIRLSQLFTTMRGVRAGINRNGDDLSLLKAVAIDGGDAGISKALRWLDALRERPGWLIFFTHDIRKSPSPWGCKPHQFDAVLDRIQELNFDVVTVSQAADKILSHDLERRNQACAER
jgi:peptidoglycan/xylan/chitin deacetylase (PgdA/CDA1 family)